MDTNFVKIPSYLSREILIEEFGINAVVHYERRLKERELYNGNIYLNPLKTIYIWATRDRKTNSGFYSTVPVGCSNRRHKNYGGS